MFCDYKQILDNLPSSVFIAEIIKDSNNIAIDFKICYKNKFMTSISPNFFNVGEKYSDFKDKLPSQMPWEKLLLQSATTKKIKNHTFYSTDTETWYKFSVNCLDANLVICSFTDITTEMSYTMHLKDSFTKDTLTGLACKECFFDDLTIIYENSKIENNFFAVCILSLDDMKDIYKSQEQYESDKFISKASDVLKYFERDSIKIYRFNDEEFAILITNFDSIDSIFTITDTIFEAFQMNEIHISAGVSVFPYHTKQKNELLAFSNMALQQSKENGKNQINYFEINMQRKFIQRLTLQTKMTTAIAENNFRQFYQPQFDIKTGKLRGFEALIRWHDKDLGDIAPSNFIPLAEETNLIIPIGQWVMKTAIETLKIWQKKYNFSGIISINVSPIQLKQETFLYELEQLILKNEINPNFIEIEVTEGVFINNIDETIEKLKKAKSMGLRISLDDFGTGYSSLSYLQSLPLNTLKIDKSFINDICSDDGIQANITSSIINMVSKMGLETIAEGVENENQLNLLNKFNCNVVQGFYRGKPMPFERCNDFLSGDNTAILKN